MMMTRLPVGLSAWLLSGEQPPVALLAAVRQLELDVSASQALHRLIIERHLSSAQTRDQLRVLCKLVENVAQGLAWHTPGDQLVLHEPDSVAFTKTPLGVIPRRRRNCAGADACQCLEHCARVRGGSVLGVEARRRSKPRLKRVRRHDLHLLVGE